MNRNHSQSTLVLTSILLFLGTAFSHQVDQRTDILHITEKQLDSALHKHEHLLLYYMDRRDSACMSFLDNYLTLPTYFSEKGTKITVGVLELTPAFGAGSAFGVHHFPYVKLFIDGVDHTPLDPHIHEIHTVKQIIQMVEDALAHDRHHADHLLHSQHRVVFSNDPEKVENYLNRFHGRVLYCASGHEFHHYRFHQHIHPGGELMNRTIKNLKKLSRRLRHEDVGFAVLNVSYANYTQTKICSKLDTITVSNSIDGHEDLHVNPHAHYRHLYHTIKLKIHPHIIDADKKHTFQHHLQKSLKPLFVLFYNRKHKDTYDQVLERMSINKENFDKISFVKAALDHQEGRSLAHLLGVETKELPCVVIVEKFKPHNMTKYKVHVPERRLHNDTEKRAFFENVLSNWHNKSIKHHWKSEKSEGNKRQSSEIEYIVSEGFDDLLSKGQNDLIMMFYYTPQNCRFCKAVGEFLIKLKAFLQKHYNFTIDLGRSDLHKNEFLNVGYYNIKNMPAVFLYSKHKTSEPLDIGYFIRKFDIENVFYSFESHSNLQLDVTHIQKFQRSVMDIKDMLLGVKAKSAAPEEEKSEAAHVEKLPTEEISETSIRLDEKQASLGHDEL